MSNFLSKNVALVIAIVAIWNSLPVAITATEVTLFPTDDNRLENRIRHGCCGALVNRNAGKNRLLVVAGESFDDLQRSILRFDLNGLTGMMAADNPTLKLSVEGSQYAGRTMEVYKIKPANAGWIEGRGASIRDESDPANPGESTWNNRAHPATPWVGGPGLGLPGIGGYEGVTANSTAPLDSVVYNNEPVINLSIPKAVIDSWIANPASNAGLLLRDSNEATVSTPKGIRLYSKDQAGTSLAPMLTFDAVTPFNTLIFQQGVDGYVGTQDTQIQSGDPFFRGTSETVAVDSGVHGLLEFGDIFGPDHIPIGSAITSARLTLQVLAGTNITPSIPMHRILQEWDEGDSWNTWGEPPHNDQGGVQTDGSEAAMDPDVTITTPIELGTRLIDVTNSVQAWSDGAKNYGWAFFLPSGSDGWNFASSENQESSLRPKLSVSYTLPPPSMFIRWPGDANQDREFNAADIILALAGNKYESGKPATWAEGDWNGAPDPTFTKSPPPGDGLFNSNDIIIALGTGLYEAGPYAATIHEQKADFPTVPEPSTLAIAIPSVVLFSLGRRRHRLRSPAQSLTS